MGTWIDEALTLLAYLYEGTGNDAWMNQDLRSNNIFKTGLFSRFFEDVFQCSLIYRLIFFGIMIIALFFFGSKIADYIRMQITKHIGVGTEFLYDLSVLMGISLLIVLEANDASYTIKSETDVFGITRPYIEFNEMYFLRTCGGLYAFSFFAITYMFGLWSLKYLNKGIILSIWFLYLTMSVNDAIYFTFIPPSSLPLNSLFVFFRSGFIMVSGMLAFGENKDRRVSLSYLGGLVVVFYAHLALSSAPGETKDFIKAMVMLVLLLVCLLKCLGEYWPGFVGFSVLVALGLTWRWLAGY